MLEEEYNPRRALPRHLRPAPDPAPEFTWTIRAAEATDVPDMREIYNHYVANSTVTFDEDALTLKEFREKFRRGQAGGYPWIVAVSPGGQVLGYANVSPWKEKAAYRYTVEDSIYLGAASTGKGLGTALFQELLDRATDAGMKEVIAVIADRGAEASIAMHKRFGFTEVGHMGKVGFKFDRWLGTYMLQKSLKKKKK
jgi:phosphinothricin acetyltransferase